MRNTNILTTKIKITSDFMFALLISVMFCHYTLFDYFAVVIGKLPFISVFKSFFFPVLYLFLVLLALKPSRFKWIRATDIGIILFVTLAILGSVLLYPNNTEYIAKALWSGILPCLPFFLLGLSLNLDENTYKIVNLICCLAIIVNAVYMIYFLGSGRALGGSHGEDYSMYRSYLLLPNTMFALDYTFKSKKLFPLISSLIGIVYAFAMGTRGPIVILAVFIAVCVWRYINLRTSIKILAVTLVGVAVVIFVYSPLYIQALTGMQEMLVEAGVSTRVVDYLLSGEMISHTSGREDIYADLLNKLMEQPIFGYGVYGEYPLGYPAGAHNIYLQIVFNFGYPLGIVLLISYIAVFIKALIKSKGTLAQSWIALFGCLVFVRGIFGGNYLDYTLFFLLGLCLKSLRESRYKLKNK